MVPSTQVALDTAEAAKQVLRLIDALDDHDDVQEVYANFDVPDEVMAAVEV
jgi:transcriptional/translational regulatory protein YebC/TACO1